MLANLLSVLRR